MTLEGEDADAFKLAKDKVTVSVLTADEIAAIDYKITSYVYSVSGNNVNQNMAKNLQVQTDGAGTVLWVVLPKDRDEPTAQEIADYVAGTYVYTEDEPDEETNTSRRLQDDDGETEEGEAPDPEDDDEEELDDVAEGEEVEGEVEEEEEDNSSATDNEFEEQTAKDHEEWLVNGYRAGEVEVYEAGVAYKFNAKDLWAGEGYKVYATLKMMSDQLSEVAKSDAEVDFTTDAPPKDAPFSCKLKGGDKPQGDTLKTVGCACGEAIGFDCGKMKMKDEWVYAQTRMRSLASSGWDVVTLLQADPSGGG
jgi:hypothetical protein